jgi:hypothetical protein
LEYKANPRREVLRKGKESGSSTGKEEMFTKIYLHAEEGTEKLDIVTTIPGGQARVSTAMLKPLKVERKRYRVQTF